MVSMVEEYLGLVRGDLHRDGLVACSEGLRLDGEPERSGLVLIPFRVAMFS